MGAWPKNDCQSWEEDGMESSKNSPTDKMQKQQESSKKSWQQKELKLKEDKPLYIAHQWPTSDPQAVGCHLHVSDQGHLTRWLFDAPLFWSDHVDQSKQNDVVPTDIVCMVTPG